MKALYLKYKDFIMEVIHFGMVGVINTLMGWVIMAVLYNLIHMSYWVSSGISYFIGSVFSYHANAKLTFKVEERDKWSALAVCRKHYRVLSDRLYRGQALYRKGAGCAGAFCGRTCFGGFT